jgi:anti-anti-sigma factor
MEVVLSKEGSVTVVKPSGPVMAGELDELDRILRTLTSNWVKRVVLNMSDSPLIDSAGLELLHQYRGQMSEHGLRLKICGLNDVTQKIFDLTKLSSRFEIFPDMTTAVRSFL